MTDELTTPDDAPEDDATELDERPKVPAEPKREPDPAAKSPPQEPKAVFTPPPLVHTQQTTKQPVVWRCPNPECRESNLVRYYEWEGDYPECPKCGQGPPAVHKRVLIHLLVPDKNGRIQGQNGRRFKIACSPGRRALATRDNGEAATGDMAAANCPGCLAAVGNNQLRTFPIDTRAGR